MWISRNKTLHVSKIFTFFDLKIIQNLNMKKIVNQEILQLARKRCFIQQLGGQ